MQPKQQNDRSWLDAVLRACLHNRVIVLSAAIGMALWGIAVSPFDWNIDWLERDPVPVDAIPDLGENQQIVFTQWTGRSPQDVEDQIGYPLTAALMGVPGVRTVRSYSMFGFSTVYVIFDEEVDFYWSRSRVLERISSLPRDALPAGTKPTLGPDATALGQVFWYTLEGRDERGQPTGGWDLHELRSIQDWQVRYALLAAEGVSEVASVGGFVQEYQIDVDPDAMRLYGVSIEQVFDAVRMANRDVGARTIEINRVEYVIRGIGFVKSLADIEEAVVVARDNVPVYVRNVAHVQRGPALRRGALDKGGAEVVGGVVAVRYGENPLQAIEHIRRKIAEIAPGLPRKTLEDGSVSQVQIVPFYDRTDLIRETLGTLREALNEEVLVTVIVVLVMLMHVRSAALVSGLLPLSVLLCFIAMKVGGVDANIVALSGIAIAVGTMVDMGIVLCENALYQLQKASAEEERIEVVFRAVREVAGAVLTAVLTTVISFLPIFFMRGAEGKLFKPLAFTKTFALIAAVVVSLSLLPTLLHLLMNMRISSARVRGVACGFLALSGGLWSALYGGWIGLSIALFALFQLVRERLRAERRRYVDLALLSAAVLLAMGVLSQRWLPLGVESGSIHNFVFVALLVGGLLVLFSLLQRVYPRYLRWCLANKILSLLPPVLLVLLGSIAWLGLDRVISFMPSGVRASTSVRQISALFPGFGKEFMPSLDEGSFLWMPTTMPHASIGEALDVLQKQDRAIAHIAEVESAVGKIGRADTPLDPAPISMIETIVQYRPEYVVDETGRRIRFAFIEGEEDFFRTKSGEPALAPDGLPYRVRGRFKRDAHGLLIRDNNGRAFRQWRPPLDPELNPGRDAWAGIRTDDDIWSSIVRAGRIVGSTSAPKLQPIAARMVMLQSGLRAPMGVQIKGPDLASIETFALEIQRKLKQVPSVKSSAVSADRTAGKPYLEIEVDREAIARYGIRVQQVQDVIEVAVGGKRIATTVEGRERYPLRVRYMREFRDSIEELKRVLVAAPGGVQIPLGQLTNIRYARGPQVIKGEDGFLVGYVLFDRETGWAEVDVVEQCRDYMERAVVEGRLVVPPGISYAFIGSYQNQLRAQKTLNVLLPLSLWLIFMVLYVLFRRVSTALLVFSGIAVAWAGGFVLMWLYGQNWFLNIAFFETSLRSLFNMGPINLSVAVWVGFLALFGIASDNGVIIATYLNQVFSREKPYSVSQVRAAALAAGVRRIRPCLMTAATTIIALIPVLSASGRGADILVPMAIPTVGGMVAIALTAHLVPVLYCSLEEWKLRNVS